MNEELAAIKAAMDNGDFVTARDLSSQYVRAHPDEFADYDAIVDKAESEAAALAEIVKTVEALRAAGLEGAQYRAEAYHLATWEPQEVSGSSEPRRRNGEPQAPQKRTRK